MLRNQILHGDCYAVLQTMEDNSVDAMVTDPPAGIGFMGRDWDKDKGGRDQWIAWLADIMREAMRVVKPGGHAFVWALPRTSHWTAMALEDAGWETRDVITHLFGSGFPKSLAIDKAIDAMAGMEREYVGPKTYADGTVGHASNKENKGWQRPWKNDPEAVKRNKGITLPATDAAKEWQGWGTALKPASEHWILCRKPIAAANIASNVLEWGTGGLNIDSCRIAGDVPSVPQPQGGSGQVYGFKNGIGRSGEMSQPHDLGRWPPNVCFTHSIWCQPDTCTPDCPVFQLDAQAGERTSGYSPPGAKRKASLGKGGYNFHFPDEAYTTQGTYGDTGGASRFFPQFWPDDAAPFKYVSKPARRERDKGCEMLDVTSAADMVDREAGSAGMQSPRAGAGRTNGAKNTHPTLKSTELMRWLCRLVTPKDGIVLDPFGGSGTTALAAIRERFGYVLIEREEEYVKIARNRIGNAHGLWELVDGMAVDE